MINTIVEVWDSSEHVSLTESQSQVDGEHIIARAAGEAFFPDRASRNNRFYPKEAWTNALKDEGLQTRLDKRLVFGSVGHDQPLDDVAIREGKISHIVNRVWIDESTGKGMAEFLILNTPSGRTLNTLLRAGSAISVSTRARGEYLDRKNEAGQNVIDPSKFALDSVDFVIDPGFLDAKPSLVEEIEREKEKASLTETAVKELLLKDLVETTDDEDTHAVAPAQLIEETPMTTENQVMDAAVLEALKAELSEVQESRNTALELLEAKQAESATVVAERDELAQKLEAYAELGTVEEVAESLKSAVETLERYTALGTVESLTQIKKAALETTEAYTELGDVADVKEALETSKAFFETVGTPAEITEALSLLEQFAEIGTPADIKEALEAFNTVIEELGTPAEITEALSAFEALVDEVGTPDQIREALSQSEQFFGTLRNEQVVAEAADIARRTLLKTEAVIELMNSGKSAEDILGMFESESESEEEPDDEDDAEIEGEAEEAKASESDDEEESDDDSDDDSDESDDDSEDESDDESDDNDSDDDEESDDSDESEAKTSEKKSKKNEEADADDEESDGEESDDEDGETDESVDVEIEESVEPTLTEKLASRFKTHRASALMEGNRYTVYLEDNETECPVPSTRGSGVSRAARLMK